MSPLGRRESGAKGLKEPGRALGIRVMRRATTVLSRSSSGQPALPVEGAAMSGSAARTAAENPSR